MTLISSTEPEILQVSYSSLNRTYNSCERRFELNKLYAATHFSESLAGDAGNALHKAQQAYWITGDKVAATWALMQHYPIKYQKSVNMKRSLQECYATLLAMMDSKALAAYELAKIKISNGRIVPAVEVPFAINLLTKDGTPFFLTLPDGRLLKVVYVGYIDAILYDAFNDIYIVCDIKTTQKYRTDYTPMFQFDSQCLPYAFVLEKILGLQFDTLTVKYFVSYIDALEPRALMYTFEKTKNDVLEWARWLAKTLREIRMYTQMNWFPRNGLACDTFGVCAHSVYCHTRDRNEIERYLELSTTRKDDRPPFEPWFELDLHLKGL
jgi:hypothetical protein